MTASDGMRLGGRPLAAIDRALEKAELASAVVAGVVIFLVMIIGVAEIFLRKTFNAPLYGQLDLIEQTMAAYALLPISYCWRKAGHVRVDLVIDFFGGRRRHVADLATTVLALLLVTAIFPGIVHFFDNAWEIGDSTINTRWPTWPSKFVPIVAFALLWVRIVLEILGQLRLIADPDLTPVAIQERHHPVDEAIEEAKTAAPDASAPR